MSDLSYVRGMLTGKVALITGAASGIGRATSLLFAQAGAAIVLFDQDTESGQDAAREIADAGGHALFVAGNVTHAADCARAVRETLDAFGGLHILFNNAGIICRASVVDTIEAEWDLVMAVNVKSIFLLSKEAIPHMAANGGGVIINTGSDWGLVGGQRAASYCASKGAVVNLTRAMALDHSEQGIRVNCICPGDTATPMLQREAAQLGVPDERFLVEAADLPLRRIGQPLDIAQAALYLASAASAFITGTVLVVDGGGLAG